MRLGAQTCGGHQPNEAPADDLGDTDRIRIRTEVKCANQSAEFLARPKEVQHARVVGPIGALLAGLAVNIASTIGFHT